VDIQFRNYVAFRVLRTLKRSR